MGRDADVIPWLGKVRGDLRRVLLLLLLYLLTLALMCERVCASAVVRVVNACVCGTGGCN